MGSQIILHIYSQPSFIRAVEGRLDKPNILNNTMVDFLGIYEIIKPNNDYLNLEGLEIWLTFLCSSLSHRILCFFPSVLCPLVSNLRLRQIPQVETELASPIQDYSPSSSNCTHIKKAITCFELHEDFELSFPGKQKK
jgi:hypothetical protein